MKKILIPLLIACALIINSNSFCMLVQRSRITRSKTALAQQRKFHISLLVSRSKQYKIAEQNNLLLQKISAQLDIIQNQSDRLIEQCTEKNSKNENKSDWITSLRRQPDHFRLTEIESHAERHRRNGGFDPSNPYPYEDYYDYMRYNSY